jgi:hypothetical protein
LLGRVGNSGSTNGAHLHFNVTNHPSPATAQGVPFVFLMNSTCWEQRRRNKPSARNSLRRRRSRQGSAAMRFLSAEPSFASPNVSSRHRR